MGARIAAHFANAGVPALLLDLPAADGPDRNALARKGIDQAAKQKPPAFFTAAARSLVTPGNLDDDLPRIADCDWILEAVVEDPGIKRDLWRRVAEVARPDAILSTNTSGISIALLCEGFPPEFRRRFLGVHFFNPPRYLHLVELVPGPETSEEILLGAAAFCDRRLGKGVVPVKDTPNFIANRIGAFFFSTALRIAAEGGYTVEETDFLTGPLIGLPKSATFRLLDIIGLDVWKAVLDNLAGVESERWRDRLRLAPFAAKMISLGWLGEKSGQGFYRRLTRDGEKVIQALDLNSLEYRDPAPAHFPAAEVVVHAGNLPERLRQLVEAGGRAGDFLWKLCGDVFVYAAERIPEIADRVVEIDRAMRWGYGFALGPFEMWDALGFAATARRLESEGAGLPESVQRMLSSGAIAFYERAGEGGESRTRYFDLVLSRPAELEERPGILEIAAVRRAGGTIRGNQEASLLDLGDGVACVEFHSKMNTLGDDALAMLRAGVEEAERNFTALVIANQGEHFSAGANLRFFLEAAETGDFARIDSFLRRFQELNLAIRHAARPVVAAPFGFTLGGGCEVVLHAPAVQAGAELSMGLVEVNVGLVPAGGGCLVMLRRLGAKAAHALIRSGRMSSSAAEAREMGLLDPGAPATMNPERLVADAKQLALSLAARYVPAVPGAPAEVEGEAACAALRLGAWLSHQAGEISEHDRVIADKLAWILSGGRLTGRQTVPEQYILDLEREAFLSLCGMEKTRQRIEHTLRTGGTLRN